jgi:Fic family protein
MDREYTEIRQKLAVIQKQTGLTQTQLALKLGVSFPALNGWWTGKSVPRPKARASIEEFFLEVTGQKTVSEKELFEKKEQLLEKSKKHKNIITEILENPDIRDRFILTLTYNSNKIEGSTLTEPDTAAIIFDNIALPDKSLTEQLEAKNHQTALNFLFEHILKKEEISESLLLRLHGILMNGIRPDAGQYRQHAVRILGVDLPTANYISVPKLITKLITEKMKENGDIIALSAQIHSEFEKIHPFADGNGRIGRLLMNAMLLQKNFTPAIIQDTQKGMYYMYLYKAQTKGDMSSLEDFICDSVAGGFKILEREDMK